MKAVEKAKIGALGELRIPAFAHFARLISNLCWLLGNDPSHTLTPEQRYLLDLACWHYRRSLGGVVDFDLPDEAPVRSRYVKRKRQVQERLL